MGGQFSDHKEDFNYQFVMRYWVRTVSDSIMRMCGVIAMTAVSSFLTIRLTVQT